MKKTETLVKICYEEETVILKVCAEGQDYSFFFGSSEDEMQALYEHADGRTLNLEYIGCYTGIMIGLFASANGGESDNEASFEWFSYCGRD